MAQTLNCPSCGAPLDSPTHHEPTIRCSFCGNTVILPEALRRDVSLGAFETTVASNFDGLDVGAIQQVMAHLQSGRKIEAIKYFRQAFKVDLKAAKEAVEALERNKPISLKGGQIQISSTSASVSVSDLDEVTLQEVMTYLHDGQKIQAIKVFREATGLGLKESKEAVEALERTGQFFSPTGSYQSPATTTSTAKLIRTVGCWIVALVLVITIVLVAAPFVFTGWLMNSSDELIEQVVEPGSTPMQPPTIVPSPTPGFADLLLKFGGEGINPGQFTDARRVAVDGQGYIYVGEWDGGRIQRFDPTGNFVSMWEVERRRAVTSLAADRAGVVYVVQGASLLRFNGETGEALDEMPRHESGGYDIVTIAPDGTILAATSDELIRFDANFNPIEGFAAGRLRELDLDTTFPPAADSLAIDGLGNIYALDGTNELVMKFAPDGRLLDHFALNENGSHDAIAVDGQGHLYIGYSRHIDIYDLEGRYIDKIEFDGLAFGLAVNGEDELWVASRTEILKFARHRR